LSDTFPIQNDLKQGYALTTLLFNFAVEYAIRMIQKNQVEVKLSGTHQLLFCADDVNLLGNNVGTMKKNTQGLIDTNEKVGMEVNAEKNKYMLLSHYQNAGQNHNMMIAKRSLKMCHSSNIWDWLKSQNLIHEEMKRRFNSGNACYHSIQNSFFSHLLIKIRIYKTIILPVSL
jgi:hypothetical protein